MPRCAATLIGPLAWRLLLCLVIIKWVLGCHLACISSACCVFNRAGLLWTKPCLPLTLGSSALLGYIVSPLPAGRARSRSPC